MVHQVAFAFSALVFVSIGALQVPQPLPSDGYLDSRIVGGRDADISEFPYQISLEYKNEPQCGGSILSSTFVLTAAHCLENDDLLDDDPSTRIPPEDLQVRAGSSILLSGGQVVQVLSYDIHPSFRGRSAHWDYDIAILKIQPLSFNNNVRPVTLASGSMIPEGTGVTVSGWGRISEDGPPSKQLQAVELSIINRNQCNHFYHNILTDRMLCAGYLPGGLGSCYGDSGGPLVADGVQYGIVSFGSGCAKPDLPTLYANVVSLRSFINQITGL